MKKGFTLVELLAAIAILAILTIVVVPNIMKLFTKSTTDSMRIQENNVADAANLFVNDYCTHPIGNKRGACSDYLINPSKGTSSANVDFDRYICLSTLQNMGVDAGSTYIDPVLYKTSVPCVGFVYFKASIKDEIYKKPKTYLKCGTDYLTEGTDSIKDKNGRKIITVCGG